jgi:tetratricopeptide (TPR) repeat protein
MSRADNDPTDELQEILVSIDRILAEEKGGAPASPPAAKVKAARAVTERSGKAAGLKRGVATGGRRAKMATPEDIGAPFIEAIASSFAAQKAVEPKKIRDVSPALPAGGRGAPGKADAAPAAEAAPRRVWAVAPFRDRPIRREVIAGLGGAAICCAGLAAVAIIFEHPSEPGRFSPPPDERMTAGLVQRAVMLPASAIAPVAVLVRAPEAQTRAVPETKSADAAPDPIPVANGPPSPPAPPPVDSASAPEESAAEAVRTVSDDERPAEMSIQSPSEIEPSGSAVAAPKEVDSVEDVLTSPPSVARRLRSARRRAGAGELDTPEGRLKAALAHGRATADKRLVAEAGGRLGVVLHQRREFDQAEAALRESLSLYEELAANDDALKADVARICAALGQLLRDRGELDKAERLHDKAIAIDQSLGRYPELAEDYGDLARVHEARKKFDLAEQAYLNALRLHKDLKQDKGIANTYSGLGEVYYDRRDLQKATETFRKAIAVEESARLGRELATDYGNLGVVYAERRDGANACSSWRKSRRLYKEAGMKRELSRVQRALRAHSCSRQGESTAFGRRLGRFFSFSWLRGD